MSDFSSALSLFVVFGGAVVISYQILEFVADFSKQGKHKDGDQHE